MFVNFWFPENNPYYSAFCYFRCKFFNGNVLHYLKLMFSTNMSQPNPYAIFQCLMIQFNGEDASWESPGPFHRSASEHLGGSPGFGTKLRLSGFFS